MSPASAICPRQTQQRELNEFARLYNMDPQQRARRSTATKPWSASPRPSVSSGAMQCSN